MARWLVKEEPGHFSFDRLVRDRATDWTGVRNPTARLHLARMRPGDPVFFYHSGNVRAVVGIARVEATDKTPDGVRIAAVSALPRPVPLSELRPDPTLQDWALLRISRLSVVPVSDREWKAVMDRAVDAAADPTAAPASRSGSRRPSKGSPRPRAGGSRRAAARRP